MCSSRVSSSVLDRHMVRRTEPTTSRFPVESPRVCLAYDAVVRVCRHDSHESQKPSTLDNGSLANMCNICPVV